MKNKLQIVQMVSIGLLLTLTSGCKKDDVMKRIPIVITSEISEITQSAASCGGVITDPGDELISTFGVCWSTSPNPTVDNTKTIDISDVGSFTSRITGLTPNTLYNVRAYAISKAGIGYGENLTFRTTDIAIPTTITTPVGLITTSTAICGGHTTNDGGSKITAQGVCWNTSPNPTILDNHIEGKNSEGSFTSLITGLAKYTEYNIRSYAINGAGINYGENIKFTTQGGTVTDIDGNVYQTISIGSQVWMSENLKVTHYRNGNVIPDGSGGSSVNILNYNNLQGNSAIYGKLYSPAAVFEPRGLCPIGWHVPSYTEWGDLITYLGADAGKKMKEAGTSHWASPNDGTNESGFTALPAGLYDDNTHKFSQITTSAIWFSSTKYDNYSKWFFQITSNSFVSYGQTKVQYLSVRCIRD